jgi:hypothetical protein
MDDPMTHNPHPLSLPHLDPAACAFLLEVPDTGRPYILVVDGQVVRAHSGDVARVVASRAREHRA